MPPKPPLSGTAFTPSFRGSNQRRGKDSGGTKLPNIHTGVGGNGGVKGHGNTA